MNETDCVFEIDGLVTLDAEDADEIFVPDRIAPGDEIRITGVDEDGTILWDGGWQQAP